MKRLIFVATLAIMAVGCQKTDVNNETNIPIGFSTEVGKQTRAIVSGKTYPTTQPFAVYAYGHQNAGTQDVATTIMNNVEISYTAASGDGENTVPAKWSATGSTKYYWPNDPRTTINFYAYSPVHGAANTTANTTVANHQTLHFASGEGNGVSHDEEDGLKLTNYQHTNMYVDFMVATPVTNATCADQDGTGEANPTDAVPVSFAHKMTQVNFTVKIIDNASYPNVDFTIKSITLNNIISTATYSYNNEVTNTLAWDPNQTLPKSLFTVFPATSTGDNNAPELINPATNYIESEVVLHTDVRDANAAKTSFYTTPVTMIPQTLVASAAESGDQAAVSGQSFTITYEIEGTGVATETVVKTFDLAGANLPAWEINKKITYTLTIGLNEITFNPSVVDWDPSTSGSYGI